MQYRKGGSPAWREEVGGGQQVAHPPILIRHPLRYFAPCLTTLVHLVKCQGHTLCMTRRVQGCTATSKNPEFGPVKTEGTDRRTRESVGGSRWVARWVAHASQWVARAKCNTHACTCTPRACVAASDITMAVASPMHSSRSVSSHPSCAYLCWAAKGRVQNVCGDG